MASLLPNGKQHYETSAGIPLVGGQLFTYDAGTTNPRVTYSDFGGTVPNANPVVLDARGEALIFWSGAYKVVLKDALGNTIWTVDNISGIDPAALLSAGGAGLIGFNYANFYSAGTIGAWLQGLVGSAGSTFIGFLQAGVAALVRPIQSKLRDVVSPQDFMTSAQIADVIAGTVTLDVTAAIQSAINTGKSVFFPDGTYKISPQTNAVLPNVFSANSVCLNLVNSNQRFYGPGVLQLAAGVAAQSGAFFGNVDGLTRTNLVFDGLNMDGNSANAGTSLMSQVVVVNGVDCKIRNCYTKNSTYICYQLNGASTRCSIENNITVGANYGIQCGSPAALHVTNNKIYNTTNNGIDIYADNLPISQVIVSGNILKNNLNGIFMESGGSATISDNQIDSPTGGLTSAAIYCNQTTTPASQMVISNNRITNDANVANTTGIVFNNGSGRCTVEGNYFKNCDWSIWGNGGAANVDIQPNYHDGIKQSLIKITQGINQLVFANVSQQIIYGSRTNQIPYTCSPLSNANNYNNRAFSLAIAPALCLNGGAAGSLQVEYQDGLNSVLSSDPAFGGAFSAFVGGDTQIHCAGANPQMVVGKYVAIAGNLYFVFSQPSVNFFVLRLMTGSGGGVAVAGNYTATFNAALAWVEYNAAWQTT